MMKENVFNVLIYLFENYMNDNLHIDTDKDSLAVELSKAGFLNSEISKAFKWLESLVSVRENTWNYAVPQKSSVRIYCEQELKKLTIECRGFLLFLEQIGVLDQVSRELVIDRAMALEQTEELHLDQIKWVVLMVLFNQSGQEVNLTWMEGMVFNEFPIQLH